MHTITADKARRVLIPDAQPGQVFDYCMNLDGSVLLTPVKKTEPEPGKVEFIKQNGYTVGVTNRTFTDEQIKEGLAELP